MRMISVTKARNALETKGWANWTCFRNKRLDCNNWTWKTSVKDRRNEMKTWAIDEVKRREIKINQRKVYLEILICKLSVSKISKLIPFKTDWERRTFESTSHWNRS
mgnify:FL=1